MTWRGFRVLIAIILIALLCKSCLVKDTVPNNQKRIQTESDKLQVNYPAPKNVTINRIDYLESTAPIGKFGGELVSSTIGEGPKTFNPFIIILLSFY